MAAASAASAPTAPVPTFPPALDLLAACLRRSDSLLPAGSGAPGASEGSTAACKQETKQRQPSVPGAPV